MVFYVLTNSTFLLAFYFNNKILIGASEFIGGFFNAPLWAFILELACEVAFPIGINYFKNNLNFDFLIRRS